MVKFGIFIGRFQVPSPHAGHRMALASAASQCERLLVLVGSANASPSIRNPWDIKHRCAAVRNVLHSQGYGSKTVVMPLNDYPYSDAMWMTDVRCAVERVFGITEDITIFGHYKEGNDYLSWFPNWKFKDIPSTISIDGTSIRNKLLVENSPEVPLAVREDYVYYQNEAKTFASFPHKESLQFVCADALVTCGDEILLIKRAHPPGRGTWALPGGFKHGNETFVQCALRELYEETGIEIDPDSVGISKLYDSPSRSCGIPRITKVVWISMIEKPPIRAADDASDVQWINIFTAVNDMVLFQDHLGIICDMLGFVPDMATLEK